MFTGVSRCLFFFLQLKTAADSDHGRRNGSEEPTSCGFWAPSFPFFLKKKRSHYFSINRVRSGYGKSGKSMEFVFLISKPGKSMEFCEKLWKFRKGVWNFLPSTREKNRRAEISASRSEVAIEGLTESHPIDLLYFAPTFVSVHRSLQPDRSRAAARWSIGRWPSLQKGHAQSNLLCP